MIFTRMIRSETRLTSNTFSIHFSSTNTSTPAVPLLFPDQNSLYLESLPVIIRQWPPWYLVSWTQQRSTFLWDSVSTTSQTLPFRVFTLRVPNLKFLRCLLDLPQWPDPAPHTWEGAKPETPLTEIWFLPASSNVTSFVELTEQAMKILERIVDGLIRQVVSIDDSQFGFVPGRGTTDAIFVVRQLQEKYLAVNKRLYMAFVDLEKAFDRVPRKVIWWALRKLGVEEWIVRLVQGMYANAGSRVRVGEGFSKEFEVKVGVHQDSVLSPLLFIIVLEALSREFRAGVPWEDLYADDLVIIADSLEECVRRLLIWKEAMEKKGLRVNAGKTKVMICGTGLDLLQSSGEYPCAVCRTGVGNNSIYCNGCKLWVHKKCSGLQRLTPNPDYRCARCMGNAHPIDGRPQSEVQVGPDKLEVVASFCYLGDMLSAGGGCEMAVTTRVKTAWKKFRELLPVLTSRHLSYKTRGHVFSSCMWSAMLQASETWPLTKTNLQRLQHNDRAMIRQISRGCGQG